MELVDDIRAFAEMGDLSATAGALLGAIEEWRASIIFVMLVLECVPVVGLVVPGQIALAALGFWAAGQPAHSGLALYLVALAAVLVADMTMFLLGRFATARSTVLRRFVGSRASFAEALEGQGDAVLVFYQFPPYSRMFAPLLLGAADFAPKRFVVLMMAGSLLFVTAFAGLGWSVGMLGRDLVEGASIAGVVSAFFAFGLFGWAILFARRWRVIAGSERTGG